MSDHQQPQEPALRRLTPEELADLYRRITGREPSPGELKALRRWCEEWGRGKARRTGRNLVSQDWPRLPSTSG
jgi:hypothetical protein